MPDLKQTQDVESAQTLVHVDEDSSEEWDDRQSEQNHQNQDDSIGLGLIDENNEENANLLSQSPTDPECSYSGGNNSPRNTPIQIVQSRNQSPDSFKLTPNGKNRFGPKNKLINNNDNNMNMVCINNSTSSTPISEENSLIKSHPVMFNGISLLHGHTATINSVDSSKFKGIRGSGKYGRVRKRVVFKNGDCNLRQLNISKRRRRYLADIFFTLVDLQWRFTLLVFTLSFILSWLAFSLVWWLISFTHGDLDFEHLPDKQEENGWAPCVGNIWGFTSSFLFSIETQHTIGYGYRYTTEECPEAIFLMCIQSIFGVMVQAIMVGIVFAKMSRPKKRTQTLMFSRHGVICQRDGELCLMFRIGDMRNSHIIGATVRAQLIKRRQTLEGEHLPYYQHELKVGVDSDMSSVFFIWPMAVVHKIDQSSPLWGISAEELIKERFEIVLILEGVIESTGSTTQARTSYLPAEILWGHRFETLVSFKKEYGQYAVDYSLFNNTYEIDTPLCSAKDLHDLKNIQDEIKRQGLRILNPFRISANQHQQIQSTEQGQ